MPSKTHLKIVVPAAAFAGLAEPARRADDFATLLFATLRDDARALPQHGHELSFDVTVDLDADDGELRVVESHAGDGELLGDAFCADFVTHPDTLLEEFIDALTGCHAQASGLRPAS